MGRGRKMWQDQWNKPSLGVAGCFVRAFSMSACMYVRLAGSRRGPHGSIQQGTAQRCERERNYTGVQQACGILGHHCMCRLLAPSSLHACHANPRAWTCTHHAQPPGLQRGGTCQASARTTRTKTTPPRGSTCARGGRKYASARFVEWRSSFRASTGLKQPPHLKSLEPQQARRHRGVLATATHRVEHFVGSST